MDINGDASTSGRITGATVVSAIEVRAVRRRLCGILVFDLKAVIHSLTKVPPERQKILGLVKGKLPPDQDRISDLRLTSGKKFSLIGTPEGDEIKDPSQLESLPDVVNDMDVDFSDNTALSATYKNDQRNIRKVREATEKLNVNIMYPMRPGKKLLVSNQLDVARDEASGTRNARFKP
ncbi:hypothetical protein DXG03_000857 [Asterophora parasitica]|uniref:Ubiquitin-like domain-containing protein n=1 Tax=Asterophora parasitica TaxID=117018 RepID=A0A9P7GB85_9AGAR|nr:hypothetical protein DXG03_000857 [Asterophora parasitica]